MNTQNKVQEFMIKELSHQLKCKKSNEFMFWFVVELACARARVRTCACV